MKETKTKIKEIKGFLENYYANKCKINEHEHEDN